MHFNVIFLVLKHRFGSSENGQEIRRVSSMNSRSLRLDSNRWMFERKDLDTQHLKATCEEGEYLDKTA